ncbi:hypothetical protein HDV01_007096 [Terramyces sp. JEL0728]|nr:hypothetical protein HDV01_007096 [Terramyces sp. JEL0728]
MTSKHDFWVNFGAGGAAGLIGATITCPLEVVKTRLQSSLYRSQEVVLQSRNPIRIAGHHMVGVVGILHNIYKTEGITALWKGLGPNLVGVVPARAVYFSVYNKGKAVYSNWHGEENSKVHMISALTAGFATASFSNPIWLIKTRMQLQSEHVLKTGLVQYKNSIDCAIKVFKQEGVIGFYRGFSASMLGLGESTFQFVMYEYFKKNILEIKQQSNSDSTLNVVETTVASASSKFIAAVTTYPHEVIRTRLRQTPQNGVRKYTGLVQCAKLIYREEGMIALYGGMAAHLMRVVPNAAILFVSYELIMSFIK